MNRAVIFDWTGTLVNEYYLDKSICRDIEVKIAEKNETSIKKAKKIYISLLETLENSWKWYSYPIHSEILNFDWKKIQEKHIQKIKIIDNAIEVLSYLKNENFTLCLVTNAVKPVLDLRIDYLKMRNFFDLIITSDVLESQKSMGNHLKYAISKINIPKRKIYAVGDSISQDIYPAYKFGIKTILCKFKNTTYLHTNNHLLDKNVKPNYIIKNLKDLIHIIE